MTAKTTILATLSLASTSAHAQESATIRPSGSLAHLRLEEVLSIGSMSGEHDAFGRVTAIALDSRGRILVADETGPHFKVFEPSGGYLATVGRRGEGPGEFSAPWNISAGPGDSVFVWDFQRSLISVFSPDDYDWVRDVRVSPTWLVNSMIPRPDGTLVLAAFGRGDRFPVHVLGPGGTILHSGGLAIDAPNLHGFEDSLLGGYLTQTGSGYVHTTKSPYMLSFLDEQLMPVRVCRGARDLTTDPTDVVDVTDRGVGLRWGDYLHSAAILPLGEGLFVNTFRDPGDDWTLLHVVTAACELVAELELAVSVTPEVVREDLVVATRRTDYHEVVIYRVSLEEGAET